MAGFAPGTWPVSYAGTSCSVWDPEDPDPDAPEQASFESMATEMLWNWTGRKLGTTPVTVRPCRTRPYALSAPSSYEGSGPRQFVPGFGSGRYPLGGTVGDWQPVLVAGLWYNIACGSCLQSTCTCSETPGKSIALPGPVASVEQVKVNGVVLSPSEYWVRDNVLVRRNGVWPEAQDLDLEDTQEGTWSVGYEKGVPVPTGGQIAAGALACELAKAYMSDPSCGLPKRLQTVTRENVSVTVADPFQGAAPMTWNVTDIPQTKTGIWLIDSWVAGILTPRHSATVMSPDRRPNHR